MQSSKKHLLIWSLIMFGFGPTACSRANVDYKTFPDPKADLTVAADAGPQTMIIAGGCFWCTEAVFQNVKGVQKVVAGYCGDSKETADYETVCSEKTNHAEAIQITYDPKVTSYGKILKIFFSIAHDPTQLNGQGADIGRSYRSAIFYDTDDQKKVAEAYIKQLNDANVFGVPVVTTVEKDTGFFLAEDYHQNYARLHPSQPYIARNALPKVDKVVKAQQ